MTQDCFPLGFLDLSSSPHIFTPPRPFVWKPGGIPAPVGRCRALMPPARAGFPPAPSEPLPLGRLRAPAMSYPSCQARPWSQPFLSLPRPLGRGLHTGGPRGRDPGFMLCAHEQCQHVLSTELLSLGDLPDRVAGTVRMICRWEPSRRQAPFAYMFSPQALCMVGPQAWGQRPVWARGPPEHFPSFSPSPSLLWPLFLPRDLPGTQKRSPAARRDGWRPPGTGPRTCSRPLGVLRGQTHRVTLKDTPSFGGTVELAAEEGGGGLV